MRSTRPTKATFVNLLPNYAEPSGYGAKDYVSYLRAYVETVQPDLLCFDHYPTMEYADDDLNTHVDVSRAGYRTNLAAVRNVSQEFGVPFWNYFSTITLYAHSDPTEAHLAWQMFTSLAYGAKGLLYFVYWSAAGQGSIFGRGGGIMSPVGKLRGNDSYPSPGFQAHYRRTAHYDQARRLNGFVLNYGRFLLNATSTGVYRVCPPTVYCDDFEWQPSTDLAGCMVARVTSTEITPGNTMGLAVSPVLPGDGVVIGQFS